MRVGLLMLMACGGQTTTDPCTEDCLSDTTATSTGATTSTTTGTTAVPGSDLFSPAEATDLDADPGVLHVELTASSHSFEVGERTIEGYAYNAQVPGPTLRARVGDTIVVDFTNNLSDPTTLHWHGVHLPWEMDGVTWLQDPVNPGETVEVRFVADRAGTFWYHPHFDTEQQMDLGLYGVFIVEDPDAPDLPDAVWVFDSWDEAPDEDEGHLHGPDDTLREWTVNGLELPHFTADGTRRVRMLNASNKGFLSLPALRYLGNGQGLLGAEDPSRAVVLGPGERAEVEWNLDAPNALSSEPWAAAGGPAWGDPIPLLTATEGGPLNQDWPFTGLAPTQDPGVTDVTWVLEGDGEALGWMINGEQFPYVTIPSVALNSEAILEVRNLSAAEHPFHLHGMAFEVLSVDGLPPASKTMADTWNVRIRETVRLKIIADNPGDWMSHCHILPHQHLGMMTVLRVE